MGRRPLVPTLAFALWLAFAGMAMGAMWRHESAPSPAAPALDWPGAAPETGAQEGTALALDPVRPTVVLFVHPDCPCTGATLEGLAARLAAHPGRARVTVVARGDGPNVRRAREIPGVAVVPDPDGALARRFGARASGQTYAFSPQGALLLRGGLTALRGQTGPSRGLDALDAILTGDAVTTSTVTTPVLGCALAIPMPSGATR